MLAESSGVVDRARSRRHRAAAGVALERWLRTFPSFGFLLSVAPGNVERRAFDCFARASCTRLRSARSKPGSQVTLHSEGRSACYATWRERLMGFGAGSAEPHEPPAAHRHADAFDHSARRRRACDEPQRGARRPRRRDRAARARRAGRGFFRKPRCGAIAFPVEPAPRETADMVEQRIDDYVRWFRRPENRGFDLYHAQDGIGGNALATLKAEG